MPVGAERRVATREDEPETVVGNLRVVVVGMHDGPAKAGRYRRIHGQICGQMFGEYGQPTSTATSVRVRDGKRVTTDGPFAETREQLGGYYLIEAKDLNEAIGIAARIPGSRTGTIEVRPVMEIGMPA